jgi:sugar/nucleoside kinase (ribokinase family)
MLLSIGELVLDITIVPEGRLRPNDDTPARIRVAGGGQAANFCAWAAALGEPARLVSRLGDDEGGRRLVAEVEALGVEVCAVWGPQPTGVIAVLVGPNGERTMATQHGAGIGLRPEDLRDEWFRGVQLIHVPAYALFLEPLAAAARAAIGRVRRGGGMLSIDLSSAAGLKAFGVDRMTRDLTSLEPDLLFATAAEAEVLGVRLEDVATVPVVKLGSAGCIVLGELVPAPHVHEVDTTGAGDAFAAAFCISHMKGATPVEAARQAVEVASSAVTREGARPR